MRVGERAALGTVVEAFYSPFPACNYRLAKALCPENPSRPPDHHWPNCKRGGGGPSQVRARVVGSKERPGAARSHVRGGWERLLRAAACGAATTTIERLQSGRFPATPAVPAAGVSTRSS